MIGTDPFAPIGGVTPFEIDDRIAAAVRERLPVVHDTSTHPLDRWYAALPAIAAPRTATDPDSLLQDDVGDL